MDKWGWRAVLGTAAILAIGGAGGLITSTAMVSRAYQYKFEHSDKLERTLQVTGSARKRIQSDLAVWKIHISSEAKVLADAYKILKDGDTKVQAFLSKHAFLASEIAAEAVQTESQNKIEWKGEKSIRTNEIENYSLHRSYTITTSRVNAVAGPAAAVTELIEQGVKVVSDAPNYYYSKIADLKVEMIGEASRDARARADQVVNNAGCSIAEVRHARMGVMQITQPNSTEVSDSGIYDTVTIDKDVTAVVSLTLGIR